MKDASVISQNLSCQFDKPYTGTVIEEEMTKLLRNLGNSLNYKGKIMGHIKSIAQAENNYLQLSMTSLQGITVKASTGWHQESFGRIQLTTNIIILGFTKAYLKETFLQCLKGTIFEQFGR